MLMKVAFCYGKAEEKRYPEKREFNEKLRRLICWSSPWGRGMSGVETYSNSL